MRLSLKQAIDKKAELTSELKRWNNQIQTNNTNQLSTIDVKALMSKVEIGNENLDSLKLLIQNANQEGGVFPKIFRLRSLTTERANLKSMQHSILPGTVPKITVKEIEEKISSINPEISSLQKELDTFNKKTHVEYNPKVT